MSIMKRCVASTSIAIAAVIAGACADASAQVKIGAVLSVTGPASFLGNPEK
jgi:branched-chain amino acid transport system substrate-binding protein